jgi:hypothetical protein
MSNSVQLLTSSWGGHVAGVNQCKLPKVMNSVMHLSTASNAKVCFCTQTHQYLVWPPMLVYASAPNTSGVSFTYGAGVCLCTQTHQYIFGTHSGNKCMLLSEAARLYCLCLDLCHKANKMVHTPSVIRVYNTYTVRVPASCKHGSCDTRMRINGVRHTGSLLQLTHGQ